MALEAQQVLSERGVRASVVSVPSWELYDEATAEFHEEVLPGSVTARVAVEAGVGRGWERYIGAEGTIVGLDRFGASAPGERVFRELGVTATAVADAAQGLL